MCSRHASARCQREQKEKPEIESIVTKPVIVATPFKQQQKASKEGVVHMERELPSRSRIP